MPIKFSLTIVILLFSMRAYAAPTNKWNFSVGLLYENSSNIDYAPINPQSDNVLHTLFATAYQKDSPSIKTKFSLSADYMNYQNNTFKNQAKITSDLSFNSILEKQHLFWNIDNRLDRVQINQTLANIPTNQENTNYFTTGPTIVFFSNNKSTLSSDIKYENFYTEKSTSDYFGYIYSLGYLRNITRTLAMGLNAKYNKRKFTNSADNTDYSRTDVTLDVSKRLRNSSLQVNLGKTQLNVEGYQATQQSVYATKFEHELGTKTSLMVIYSKELIDYSSLFAEATNNNPVYANINSAVFLRKNGRISISRKLSNTSLRYDYAYSNDDYSDNKLDAVTRVSSISISNEFSYDLAVTASGFYKDSRYASSGRTDLSRIYNIGITKKFQNKYDLSFYIQYTNNTSTDKNLTFDERRVGLGGNYYFR